MDEITPYTVPGLLVEAASATESSQRRHPGGGGSTQPHAVHAEEQTFTHCLGSASNLSFFLIILFFLISLSLFFVCFYVFYENVFIPYYDNLWLP